MRVLPLAAGLVGAVLVLPTTPADAATCKAPTSLLTTRKPAVKTLPRGVTMRTWDTGPTSDPIKSQRIVAVRIPRSSAAVGHLQTSGALTKASTVLTYAKRHSGAVVTVNGSVFNPDNRRPVHTVLHGGVPIKGTAVEKGVVAFGTDHRAYMDYLKLAGTAKARGYTWRVTGLNWQSMQGSGINVYTTKWGGGSRPYGAVDVVVSSGKVVARRTGTSRGAALRSGQVILTATGTTGTQLSALRVGDSVSLSYWMSSWSGKKVIDAVTRGYRYLEGSFSDGGDCNSHDEQIRPRTAIGWASNGDTLVVTVSGRAVINGTLFGGATHHQMPTYMRQLGAVNAVGLDGGGSTTMWVRNYVGGAPYRVDRSTSYQRAVPTALSWY
jgi:hypothetical protein